MGFYRFVLVEVWWKTVGWYNSAESPMETPLKKEFQFYLDNQQKLVAEYKGKFIVIKDQTVVGSYDSETQAYEDSVKKFKLGTFLIQHCLAGEDSHTQVFHSRVLFH